MNNVYVLYSIVFIFGAIIGSFLNVVIYRLPIMLAKQWRAECLEYLNQPSETMETVFNLIHPRSRCSNCNSMITWWQNIPLISYILLKAKCHYCQTPISLRYPFIELLTAIVSCWIMYYFGLSWQAYTGLVFSWLLIVIIFIDYDHMIIPDQLNFSLLWLGLLVNCFYVFTPPISAIIGAVVGYVFLWLVMTVYKLITGKIGIGHGDFKLYAALGAWVGWQLLPITLLLAAFLGSVIGVSLILLGKHQREKPLPFGPYLAIAGWIVLLWGHSIMSWYYATTGLL